MNELQGVQANNDLMVVKQGLKDMIFKLNKQDNPNTKLINQLKEDCKRLDSVYLFLYNLKFNFTVKSDRNYQLESLLMSNLAWSRDLKKQNKDLENQLTKVKEEIEKGFL
jgi:hypothetical protein